MPRTSRDPGGISGSQGWTQVPEISVSPDGINGSQRYLWVPGTFMNFADICGSQECLHILRTSMGLSVGPRGRPCVLRDGHPRARGGVLVIPAGPGAVHGSRWCLLTSLSSLLSHSGAAGLRQGTWGAGLAHPSLWKRGEHPQIWCPAPLDITGMGNGDLSMGNGDSHGGLPWGWGQGHLWGPSQERG